MIFSGNPPSIENEKRRAKLYSQIYQYASEDFSNYKDLNTFIAGLFSYLTLLELRIQKLTAVLNTHTHKVAPHVHPMPIHFHISGAPGSNTSPAIDLVTGAFISTLPNIPIEGLFSTQQAAIVWRMSKMPPFIVNTTGAITNVINNIGVSLGGKLESEESALHRVRANPPKILLTPSIPTYLSQVTRAL